MKKKNLILSSISSIILLGGSVVAANTDDIYEDYSALSLNNVQEVDYKIDYNDTDSDIAIIAVHGGGIEPGTSELVKSIASDKHDYYNFQGIMKSNNSSLHITSVNFDEPIARNMVGSSTKTLSIHGFASSQKVTYIGGLDKSLIDKVKKSLIDSGFEVKDAPYNLSGESDSNICNDNINKAGVQIELSTALRASFFKDLNAKGREIKTDEFNEYVNAINLSLDN